MAHSRICSVEGCGKPHLARGWCAAHLKRWRKHGDPMICKKAKRGPVCEVDGCERPHHALGFCSKHSHRYARHGDPLGGGTPQGEPERYFREVVLAYEGDECLPWPFGCDESGYGRMHNDGRLQTVSRLVCEEGNGPPPTPGHQAAHSCGKGHLACVTKRHLSWKTRVGNEADRLLHGTSNRGERHGNAKLTNGEVLVIKRLLAGPMLQREIAAKFGVHIMTINNIKHERSWGWLTPELA